MTSNELAPPACLLLIFGIPGSGKTLLTDYLLSQCAGAPFSLLPVHFDAFYPPDFRAKDSPSEETEPFELKAERQRVTDCIEQLIRNRDQSKPLEDSNPPQLWDLFTSTLKQYGKAFENREDGARLRFLLPTVITLDDNFHLRSMRYQYYQMARKYQLGFAQMCICCTPSVSLMRNTHRLVPIPHSTIVDMEQRLELSEPSKHHWEKRSAILHNDGQEEEEFLREGWTTANGLILEALANPEPPFPREESSIKESCRAASLESYLHQADIILRKCVSATFKKYRGEGKASHANAVRRELLEEARTSNLLAEQGLTTLSPTSAEFESTLQSLYWDKLNCYVD